MSEVVADASPLIALQQISRLPVARTLFGSVIIPPAVAREIAPSVPRVPWLVEQGLAHPVAPLVLRANLGPDESEAIGLALERRAETLIVDERAALRVAEGLGLRVIGTLGILLAAKRKGLLAAVRPCIDDLLEQGFWVAPRIVERALSDAGEGTDV